LWVFYNPRYSLYEAGTGEWEVVLSLAQRWGFPEVKNLAIRELEQKEMVDVKRIKLYHEHNVDRNYLIPWYSALIVREQPLNLPEAIDLGMETAMQIAAGREQARSRLLKGARTPVSPTIQGAELYQVVREIFQIPPTAGQAPVLPSSEDTTNAMPAESSTTNAKPGGETSAGEDETRDSGEQSQNGGQGTATDNGDANSRGNDANEDDKQSGGRTGRNRNKRNK